VVVSAVVVALALGTWLLRALAAVDLVILVFPGDIFGGLSQLDVAAVGHLTAMLTAAMAVILFWRRGRRSSGGDVADGGADAVGDRGRGGAQEQLADRAAPERAVGQPGHHPAAGHGGDGGEPERDG